MNGLGTVDSCERIPRTACRGYDSGGLSVVKYRRGKRASLREERSGLV